MILYLMWWEMGHLRELHEIEIYKITPKNFTGRLVVIACYVEILLGQDKYCDFKTKALKILSYLELA